MIIARAWPITLSLCLFLSSHSAEVHPARRISRGSGRTNASDETLAMHERVLNTELILLEEQRLSTVDRHEQALLLEAEWELFSRFMSEVRQQRRRRSLRGSVLVPGWKEAQLYPFSSIVRVTADNTDCSATLVGPRHALTAAHCIHENGKYKSRVSSIRVGVQQRNGWFHWIRVLEARVPKSWIINSRRGPLSVVKYDYALLRLASPHARQTMKMGTHSFRPKSAINFAGFAGKTMRYHYCTVKFTSRRYGMVLTSCNVERGLSGSPVYLNTSKGKATVVGLVSGIIMKSRQRRYIAVKYLVSSQVQEICSWMTGRRNC